MCLSVFHCFFKFILTVKNCSTFKPWKLLQYLSYLSKSITHANQKPIENDVFTYGVVSWMDDGVGVCTVVTLTHSVTFELRWTTHAVTVRPSATAEPTSDKRRWRGGADASEWCGLAQWCRRRSSDVDGLRVATATSSFTHVVQRTASSAVPRLSYLISCMRTKLANTIRSVRPRSSAVRS